MHSLTHYRKEMPVTPEEEALSVMIRRALHGLKGLEVARDQDLLVVLMKTLQANGFGFGDLDEFRGEGARCYGVLRDRTHYAGVTLVRNEWWRDVGGLAARTTGTYGGHWIFIVDADRSVLTSHDGEACVSFNGLEGEPLIAVVLTSALTEALEPIPTRVRPPGRWRPW